MPIPRTEQETTLTWIQGENICYAFTSYPPQAAKWRKLGWEILVKGTQGGKPVSWVAKVPPKAIRFRKLAHGILPKTRKGNPNLKPPTKSKSSTANPPPPASNPTPGQKS